ncbi:unnamed protein product, partial [Owenia fusiformis]
VCRWSAWSVTQQGACSVTCGTGSRTVTQTRTKIYSISNFGNPECIGSPINQRVVPCTNPICGRRVCTWSAWGVTQRGACSVTCGTGSRTVTQTRTKIYSISNFGNPECIGSPINQRVVPCTNQICDRRVCRWSAWTVTQRGACSVTCGTGTRTETLTRTKIFSISNFGNPQCVGSPINQRVVSCINQRNPVCPPPQRRVCTWSAWSVTHQGACSVTCGTGSRTETQTRSKIYSFSNFGNPECLGSAATAYCSLYKTNLSNNSVSLGCLGTLGLRDVCKKCITPDSNMPCTWNDTLPTNPSVCLLWQTNYWYYTTKLHRNSDRA